MATTGLLTPELSRIGRRLIRMGVVGKWIGILGAGPLGLALTTDIQSMPIMLASLGVLALVNVVVWRHDWEQAIRDGAAPRQVELWGMLVLVVATANVALAIPRDGSWLYFVAIAAFFSVLLPGWAALRVVLASVVAVATWGVAADVPAPTIVTAALGGVLISLVAHGTADMLARVVSESERRARALATVAQSARAVASLNPDIVPQRVADAAMNLGFDAVYVSHWHGDGHEAVAVRTRDIPPFEAGPLPVGPAVREAVASREPVVTEDYLSSPDAHPVMRRFGIDAVVVVPVVLDGEVVKLLTGGVFGPRIDPVQLEAFDLLGGLLEQSLRNARRYERERAAVATLDELGRLKDDFISNVSHELRTPITVIIGGLQTLHERRHMLTEDTQETLLRRALANGETLQTTLEALLEFAQVERAGIEGGMARIDVVALVRGSVDRLSSLLAGHDVRVEAPRDAPVCVAHHQIERVVDNLLLNAARHTAEGTTVWVRVGVDDSRVRVEVADDGPGIQAEDLPRLTDRFFRGGHGDTRETRGLGLGLTLAHTILEAHGSGLEVSSSPGQGATFAFELPMA